MQILKAFFKVAFSLRGSIIMYVSMFIGIGVLVTNLIPASQVSFEQTKLNVVVFDEDNSTESRALYDYIAANHNIKEMENDPEKLWDNLYYHNAEYILTINKGYGEKIKSGDTADLFTYSVDPQSYQCEYLNMQLRQYVSTLDIFLKSGMDFAKAEEETTAVLSNGVEVTMHDFSNSSEASMETGFIAFLRYLAYILPSIMITVLARVIIILKGDLLKNRTLCAPIAPIKYNGQIIAGSMIFCTAIWIFTMLIVFIISGFPSISTGLLLAFLNSFVFMLISAGIGVLVSMCFSNNSFAIDMIANIVVLGMSFLCGVFVDQSLLGEDVLRVAQFLPSYWYVRAVDNIAQLNGAVFDIGFVWQCMGTEMLFAAALFALSLVVAKFRKS